MGSWTLRVSVSETKGALKGLGKELEHQKLRDLNIYQDYSAGFRIDKYSKKTNPVLADSGA